MFKVFKVNNRSTRRRSVVFIVYFEYIWHIVLVSVKCPEIFLGISFAAVDLGIGDQKDIIVNFE